MPTIQEIIAKRKELWPTATTVDAKNAITPVSPTTNANVAQLEANRARVQSQIASGERPAVGTSVTSQAEQTQAPTPTTPPPAPVTSSTTPSGAKISADGTVTPATPVTPVATPTPTPTEIKPTEPVKPVTPVKTEPVIDYTQAQGREQEIMTNLEKFKTQWMTPDQIKWASGYEQATPEKKAIIEWFLNPVKQDAGTIFSTLRAGGSVPMSDTPEYRQAQARYNTFKRFSTYDVASLSTAMQQGDLLMGTQAYNDVISDPNMLAKIQKARIFMNGEVDMVKIWEKQGQYVMTQNPTVAKALEDGYITAEEYNQMTSTPEVEAQAKVVSEAKTKYDEYKRQLEQISDDVDKEYEGKETTDSFRSAIKANRDKAVRRLYTSASDDLQNASGLYTELKNSSTQRLELNMKQYEQKQADARQIAQEQRQMQAQKDLIQYKSDFEKQQAQEALNDPYKAIPAMIEEYKKLGIPFARSTQQIIKDFESSGKDISTFLTDLQTTIQSKPEYQAYKDKQSGTEWQSTSITRYNPATWANESTPIFYRKKTNWEFEAVDLSGNKIDSSLIGGGISWTPWAISATGDMSGLASNYPYEASFKNNNTSGITWGMSTRTKWLLEKAGIKISEGTARPSREGGKYVKFDNIADWLLAHKILLSQAGSDDINARLQQWVGTKEWPIYAKNLMDQAWIKAWTKFSQLTPEQLDKLVMVQVKKESPWMYKELTKWATETPTAKSNPLQVKEFEAYNGTTIPAQYKTPLEQDDFVKRYNEWRASRPWKKIETGNDILNIRLDKGGTEWEKVSQSYTSRMLNAVNNLIPLEKKFLELGTGWQVAQTYLPSLLKSSDQKMMDAEKKNFITAVLRKQSGASIAPSEFAGEEMKYFPQPWDTKEVVIAKQNARNAEIKAMLATAGTDAEWNSLSTYYNPPVLVAEKTTAPVKTDKISTLKKNYFPN